MDKGMKKVVNVDRNIEAGTAVYFPGGGADCARVLNEYFL